MAWPEVRGKLRDLLSVVAITDPFTQTVRTVFEFSPRAIEPGNLPCFVIRGPARTGSRGPMLLQRTYTSRVQFMCRDEQGETAANIADAFSEATFTALEQAIKGDNVDAALQLIDLPDIDEVSPVEYGGVSFPGFEFTVTLRFTAAATPAP